MEKSPLHQLVAIPPKNDIDYYKNDGIILDSIIESREKKNQPNFDTHDPHQMDPKNGHDHVHDQEHLHNHSTYSKSIENTILSSYNLKSKYISKWIKPWHPRSYPYDPESTDDCWDQWQSCQNLWLANCGSGFNVSINQLLDDMNVILVQETEKRISNSSHDLEKEQFKDPDIFGQSLLKDTDLFNCSIQDDSKTTIYNKTKTDKAILSSSLIRHHLCPIQIIQIMLKPYVLLIFPNPQSAFQCYISLHKKHLPTINKTILLEFALVPLPIDFSSKIVHHDIIAHHDHMAHPIRPHAKDHVLDPSESVPGLIILSDFISAAEEWQLMDNLNLPLDFKKNTTYLKESCAHIHQYQDLNIQHDQDKYRKVHSMASLSIGDTIHISKVGAVAKSVSDFAMNDEKIELSLPMSAPSVLSSWINLSRRKVRHFGYQFNYDTNSINYNQYLGPLPTIVQDKVIYKMNNLLKNDTAVPFIGENENCDHFDHESGKLIKSRLSSLFSTSWHPDQATINLYSTNSGIPHHIDTHSCFEDGIASLSLLGDTVMEFRHPYQKMRKYVFVPRRSLMFFTNESRYLWTHGITPKNSDQLEDQVIKRSPRISITLRTVRKQKYGEPLCTCHYPAQCDVWKQKKILFKPHLGKRSLLEEEENTVNNGEKLSINVQPIINYPASQMEKTFLLPNPSPYLNVLEELNDILVTSDPVGETSETLIEKFHVHDIYEYIDIPHSYPSQPKGLNSKMFQFLNHWSIEISGLMVVDIGCGNGRFLKMGQDFFYLQTEKYDHEENVVLDAANGENGGRSYDSSVKESISLTRHLEIGSDRRIAFLQKYRDNSIDCLLADCLSTPYRDNIFDISLSINVLNHLSNLTHCLKALQELIRVVRPGGKVALWVWALERPDLNIGQQDVLMPFRSMIGDTKWKNVKEEDRNQVKFLEKIRTRGNSVDRHLANSIPTKKDDIKLYCHFFRSPELADLVGRINSKTPETPIVTVIESGYEAGCHYLILDKTSKFG